MRTGNTENQIRISAPAKINFFLELLGPRGDGFHEIDTVMQTVSLSDKLSFRLRDDDALRLTCELANRGNQPSETDHIPLGPSNLVVRAVQAIREYASDMGSPGKSDLGLDIHLKKRIPSAAGLGGASSNAAAALLAANAIWQLKLSKEQLHPIAAELGSDVPFFLNTGAAVCQGRGEKITPFETPAGLHIVIAKPKVSLSTKDVFSRVEHYPDTEHRRSATMVSCLASGRTSRISKAMFNRLAAPAAELSSQTLTTKKYFDRLGCDGHQMSGSGSSHFGIFRNRKAALVAANKLVAQDRSLRVFVTRTTSTSKTDNAMECISTTGETRWR